MRKRKLISAADFSTLKSYYEQYLLCLFSFNKLLDQFFKKGSIIVNFGKVFNAKKD